MRHNGLLLPSERRTTAGLWLLQRANHRHTIHTAYNVRTRANFTRSVHPRGSGTKRTRYWGRGGQRRNAVGSWKAWLPGLCSQEQNPLSTRREEDRTNLAPHADHLTTETNNVLSTFVPLWVEFTFFLVCFVFVCFSPLHFK